MLKDRFGRIHDYLRISITDKCNFRCTYCFPNNLPKGYFAGKNKMSVEEIDSIVSVFVNAGVKKIRFTGGEPLIRKDAKQIFERISKYPVELAITTNGVYVHEFLDVFQEVGIRSINVSLDSLQRDKNFSITQRDNFETVFNNIILLANNNFHVKVNVVIMKGVNDNEILDFIEWTKHLPIHIRFIEFMPFDGNKWSNDKVFSYSDILHVASTKYKFIKLSDEKNDTAKKFFVPTHKGTFAVISTMSFPFCNGCNRLRLTTDGKMKNCLFSKGEVDLLQALRKSENILPLINQCVYEKQKELGGQFTVESKNTMCSTISNRSMINIGG